MITYKRLRNNLVMQMFARMFPLMKRFCRTMRERVISFFKTLNLKEKLVINSFTLRVSIKKFLTGENCIVPKTHKTCESPVTSNCGTPTEKASEFLDYHLKHIMQSGKLYIKDSGDFISNIKNLENIPGGAILAAADVVGLYPSIPHEASLNALREALDNRKNSQHIPKDNLLKMAEFVSKNNYFEFNGKVKKQLLGTDIGTEFAPTYASILWINLRVIF